MTLQELAEQVQYILSEKDKDYYHKTDEVKNFLKEGANQFASVVQHLIESKVVEASDLIDAGNAFFRKNIQIDDAINVFKIWYTKNEETTPLNETSLNYLSFIDEAKLQNLEPATPEVYLMFTPNEIGLFPSPFEAGQTDPLPGDILIYYARMPKEPGDAEEFEIPPQFLSALVDYALYRSLIKDNDQRANDFLTSFYNSTHMARMFLGRGPVDGFRMPGGGQVADERSNQDD